MHKFIVSLAAAGTLLAATIAHAEMVSGTIESLDTETNVIVLDNGESYKAPEDMDLTALEVGTQVEIDYENDGTDNVVNEMAIVE
ncbi:DUF1344 domain-containing protein [Pseudahrensia aquimaris]|uniref:DUF1344 domain-containing protein n=1 Tax=Pseudahrensia aquimaris TaxID=744461 RepID=A0ABW3FBY8_9HYPH